MSRWREVEEKMVWRPRFQPRNTALFLLVVAIFFLPLGFATLFAHLGVSKISLEYGREPCTASEVTGNKDTGKLKRTLGCTQTLSLNLTTRMRAPVYMFYRLSPFYQNHRRFVSSRHEAQLAGHPVEAKDIGDACDPIKGFIPPEDKCELVYSPCGAIAWSMFNDTLRLYAHSKGERAKLLCDTRQFSPEGDALVDMCCTKRGIAWDSDRKERFRPSAGSHVLTGHGLRHHPNFFARNGYYNQEIGHRIPLITDEDLLVWMNPSSLSNFRKLWRRIDCDLYPGRYLLEIENRYNVSSFSGRKFVELRTHSWLGGGGVGASLVFIALGLWSMILGGFSLLPPGVLSRRVDAWKKLMQHFLSTSFSTFSCLRGIAF